MATTYPQDHDDHDFGYGPRLWDADPDVCCSAFQLGACVHTEAPSEYDEVDYDDVAVCICRELGATGSGQRHTLCRAHDGENAR